MDLNIQKEEFSYAHIYAVAAGSGYSFSRATRPVDMGGIDITITGITSDEALYEPKLDVQVKSTSLDVMGDEFIKYPLKLKNYNELRKEKTLAPRILVVVLIPENKDEWVQQSETELCLRRCAYWKSLRRQPETQNTESVTVNLPRQQLFTVNTLKNIMQRIETGGTL